MDRFVTISGCSGGGKSTLLQALRRRGFGIVEEPGRRIVRQERRSGGAALPWVDEAAFARRAIGMALDDREQAAEKRGWVFFDRGLIDAAAALQRITGEPVLEALGRVHRYHRRVFLAPPWPAIYRTDRERRNGQDAAIAEFERLCAVYPALGYEVLILPKASVEQRADFVVASLGTARH